MPSSVIVGSRPNRRRIFSYSSEVIWWCATRSGVIVDMPISSLAPNPLEAKAERQWKIYLTLCKACFTLSRCSEDSNGFLLWSSVGMAGLLDDCFRVEFGYRRLDPEALSARLIGTVGDWDSSPSHGRRLHLGDGEGS